jgi:hypothetical protein
MSYASQFMRGQKSVFFGIITSNWMVVRTFGSDPLSFGCVSIF